MVVADNRAKIVVCGIRHTAYDIQYTRLVLLDADLCVYQGTQDWQEEEDCER